MVLRRTDERRRRVVMDEAMQTPDESAENVSPARGEPLKSKRTRQYSRNADRRNLPRCADFVPVSRVAVLSGWCICLTCLLILNLAYGLLGTKAIARLPLTSEALGFGPRSLSNWLQVTCWSTAGLISLVIFSIRQHRSNDFRGTYRLWRWVAVECGLLSLSTLVDVSGILSELTGWLAGRNLDRAGTLLISIQVLLASIVGIRLLFELRASHAASALALAAGGCWIAALLVQHQAIGPELNSNREFVAGNLWLWTAAMAFMCLLTYARFVILHASGAIYVPERSAKQKKKKRSASVKSKGRTKRRKAIKSVTATDEQDVEEEEPSWSDEEEEAEEETEDEEEDKPKSNYSPPLSGKMKSSSRQTSSVDDESAADNSQSSLSRAERKRLKREQRQARRAA